MNLGDYKRKIKSLAENDNSISATDITDWLDDAIGEVNQALKTNFPLMTGQPDTYSPEFDSRFHEVLMLFAQKRYREQDADYNSSGYWQAQFEGMLQVMQRDMTIPPSYRADPSVQQIVVPNPVVATFNITMPYGAYFSDLEVYQNDNRLYDDQGYWTVNQFNRQITFTCSLTAGDKLTIVFVNDDVTNQPPFEWWGTVEW